MDVNPTKAVHEKESASTYKPFSKLSVKNLVHVHVGPICIKSGPLWTKHMGATRDQVC